VRKIVVGVRKTTRTTKTSPLDFDLVCDPGDLKEPINACCRAEDREIVSEAIIHFTANVPTFEPCGRAGWLAVTATGYRMGPAGDR
jgi:hypothetical protein